MVTELFEIGGDGTVYLRVHLQPGAGRTAVVGRHGDALKVRVAAPPTGGRANDACVELIASVLGVKQSDVSVAGGATSRSKRLAVTDVEADEVAKLLERALAEVETERQRGGRERF